MSAAFGGLFVAVHRINLRNQGFFLGRVGFGYSNRRPQPSSTCAHNRYISLENFHNLPLIRWAVHEPDPGFKVFNYRLSKTL